MDRHAEARKPTGDRELDRVLGGGLVPGSLVLLGGEPGIGKSCLAHQFLQAAAVDGAGVARGYCHETLGSPPFWPWLQILRQLSAEDEEEHDPTLSVLERLALANFGAVGTAVSPALGGQGGSEQLVLFSRITAYLSSHAAERPIVLFFDDLHWADRSSLALLGHLSGQIAGLPILVLGTYREHEVTRKHPLFRVMADMGRHATVNKLHLRGLSPAEAGVLASTTCGRQLPDALVQALHEKTEGNPLFLREVAQILDHPSAGWQGGSLAVEIPEGIQEAIGRRLDQLSPGCSELLSAAAVIGRKFRLEIGRAHV